MELSKSAVQINIGEKEVNFYIIHNLPDVHGLSLNDALDNWLARTKKFTAKSFVNYINSKYTEYTAMTEKQYNRISEYGS